MGKINLSDITANQVNNVLNVPSSMESDLNAQRIVAHGVQNVLLVRDTPSVLQRLGVDASAPIEHLAAILMLANEGADANRVIEAVEQRGFTKFLKHGPKDFAAKLAVAVAAKEVSEWIPKLLSLCSDS